MRTSAKSIRTNGRLRERLASLTGHALPHQLSAERLQPEASVLMAPIGILPMPLLALLMFAASATNSQSCSNIDRLSSLPEDSTIIFGEVHGSQESPQFVAEAVCMLSVNHNVLLAIELPDEEQGRVGRYLTSSASRKERLATLLRGPIWQSEIQDGRSSKGMIKLLDRIRELRDEGRSIEVVTLDVPWDTSRQVNRDEHMAQRFMAALIAHPDATPIVQIGNYHARVRPKDERGASESFAERLESAGHSVAVLRSSQSGGKVWVCRPPAPCGIYDWPSVDPQWKWRIEYDMSPKDGFHGIYYIGEMTPSQPAREITP